MTRRWALAAAFLLTVVCGFLIVAYGSGSGVFAWADRGGQSTAVVQTQPGQQTTPSADIIITDASIPTAVAPDAGPATTPPRRDGGGGERHSGEGGGGGEHEGGED